ncbi:uncharacterized protein LOC124150178 [Haliotis rufescens]|uniref:uncharacterized protein LOC124150178 n=1 Tax=Haliotis rufescens TaxID=6454 RepID=UPI00201F45F7|nr:uncharacterized protein LOC124150178 [Haliotis rufescens]
MGPSSIQLFCIFVAYFITGFCSVDAGHEGTVYVQHGGAVNLSLTLPQPGVREMTVRHDIIQPLLHVTDYNTVSVNETYKSRTQFTGLIDSQGDGGLSFLLSGVDWSDGGDYSCYTGSQDLRGSLIEGCVKTVVVIGIEDLNITAPDKANANSNLVCQATIRFCPGIPPVNVSFIWRKNGVQLDARDSCNYTTARASRCNFVRNYTSTLPIGDGEHDGDEYTCRIKLGNSFLSNWSQEYVLGREFLENTPNSTAQSWNHGGILSGFAAVFVLVVLTVIF